jgi:hypothetical protein
MIVSDGEAPPAYTMGSFTESTVPGCRAPHFWLADGRSLYDAFGPGYTLLRFDAAADVAPLLAAARALRHAAGGAGRAGRDAVPEAYRHRAGAVPQRPARGLARRCVPADAAALVAVLRGAGVKPAAPRAPAPAAVLETEPHG